MSVSARYVRAVYDLAQERGCLDKVSADLRLIGDVLSQNAELRGVLKHPRLSRQEAEEVAAKIAEACGACQLTRDFLVLAARGGRMALLGAMASEFLAATASGRGETVALVRSARPLSAAQKERLAAELSALSGGKVSLEVSEDPELLGGIAIRMGSRFIDASVKGRLERVGRSLKSQQEAA